MNKVLLISVKPEFAEKILSGEKRIELRKSVPNVSSGDVVIIYSTHPEKAVLGSCVVEKVIQHTPNELWKRFSSKLGIDKKRYLEYFRDHGTAVGIVLTSARRYENRIPLNSIKDNFPGFSPPQTYKYLPSSLQKWVVTRSNDA